MIMGYHQIFQYHHVKIERINMKKKKVYFFVLFVFGIGIVSTIIYYNSYRSIIELLIKQQVVKTFLGKNYDSQMNDQKQAIDSLNLYISVKLPLFLSNEFIIDLFRGLNTTYNRKGLYFYEYRLVEETRIMSIKRPNDFMIRIDELEIESFNKIKVKVQFYTDTSIPKVQYHFFSFDGDSWKLIDQRLRILDN